MSSESESPATEIAAIQTVHATLEPLSDAARQRVLRYVASLFAVEIVKGGAAAGPQSFTRSSTRAEEAPEKPDFKSFAELYDAANPSTNADKALVAGYWLQFHQGVDGFDSQTANKELKNLGHGLGNVTAALSALKEQKPALALQVKKSGTSQQARKVYKITVAGEKEIMKKLSAISEE